MTRSSDFPEVINAMAVMSYTVPQLVDQLKDMGMEESEITIEVILDHIYEDVADYFGTNNLIFQDENGEEL